MRASKFIPFLILISTSAQARVFDINKETFAGYALASVGGSTIGTKAVDGEAAGNVKYSNGSKYNYSGEFGFVYSRPGASLRFGFEIFRPSQLETTASISSTDQYSATSDVLGYAPKVSLEFNLHGNNVSRSYVGIQAGLASFTMKNEYTLTAAGQSTYSGVGNHTTEAKGDSTLFAAALGYENILSDRTTIVAEFGYRMLKVDTFKYSKDVTTFSGSKQSGDTLKDVSGNNRSLDLSGGFLSIGFRFYL